MAAILFFFIPGREINVTALLSLKAKSTKLKNCKEFTSSTYRFGRCIAVVPNQQRQTQNDSTCCTGRVASVTSIHVSLAVYKSGTGTRGRGHRDACVGTWDLGTREEGLEDINYGTRGRVGRGRGDVKYRDAGDAGCE